MHFRHQWRHKTLILQGLFSFEGVRDGLISNVFSINCFFPLYLKLLDRLQLVLVVNRKYCHDETPFRFPLSCSRATGQGPRLSVISLARERSRSLTVMRD